MMPRLNRKLGSDNSGAALVEFGILVVPLLMVVLGFCELGYRGYVRSTLQGSLNDVARIAAVENPKLGNGGAALEDRIKQRLLDRMGLLAKNATYDFKIDNFRTFGSIGTAEALITDVNGNGKYDPGDCWEDSNPNKNFDLSAGRSGVGGADDVVVYEVTMTVPHLFPVMGLFKVDNVFDVSATTMIRTQPYAEQRVPEVTC